MSYILRDNYDCWVAHDAEQQRQLDRLPKCDICDEAVQDEYCFQIEGTIICVHCMNEYFRKDVEDLVE